MTAGREKRWRYLSAKRTVDDRALNRNVWSRLRRELEATGSDGAIRVLEVGCGIGTGLDRLLEWKLFQGFRQVDYRGIDIDSGAVEKTRQRLLAGELGSGCEDLEQRDLSGGRARFVGRNLSVDVSFHQGDLLASGEAAVFDLIVAQAVLDLVDAGSFLTAVCEKLRPGGLFYFPITFDGATVFQPDPEEIDPRLDRRIEELYHRTMDRRIRGGKASGDSRTGRHLFGHLHGGAELLEAGSSDWVVFPSRGDYPHDEAFFLEFILDTMQGALSGVEELSPGELFAWHSARMSQLSRGELVYIAHQLDFLGRLATR